MTDPHCDDVLLRLELGHDDGLAGHLATCARCRAAADEVRRLGALLAVDAALDPPPGLDARVRTALTAGAHVLPLRPWLAGGLAVASFTALVTTLALVLSSTPIAENGPIVAVGLGLAYLALCAAAVLPLLLNALGHPGRATEVEA